MRQHTKIAVGLIVLLALAGCIDGLIDGGADDPVEHVPSDAEFVVHVDMAVTQDEDTLTIVDALAEDDPSVNDSDEAIEEFEDEVGLDPAELSDVTVYMTPIDDAEFGEPQEEVGIVLYADWDEDELIEAIEENEATDYEETEWDGVTVYEPEEEDFSPMYVAVLDEGEYVIGDEGAVEGAIAVANGEDDGISDDMRDAFEDLDDGYVTFVGAADDEHVPDETPVEDVDTTPFEDISVVAGSYGTDSGEVVLEVQMHADSENSATDVADVTDGGVSMLRGLTDDDDVKDQLQNVEVEQDGDRVIVTYESDVDDIVEFIEEAGQEESDGIDGAVPVLAA